MSKGKNVRVLSENERLEYLAKNGRRDDFLHRQNVVVDGFDFDSYTFEDLIDNFTPESDIPIILGVSRVDLDYWCRQVYNGMDFPEAFAFLSRKALFYCRKAYTNLSKSGNNTAMNIVAKHFMKLEDDENKRQAVIPVVAAIPVDGGVMIPGVGVGTRDEDIADSVSDSSNTSYTSEEVEEDV